MKRSLLLLTISLFFIAHADIINMNPDPNGEPWWAGGWKTPDPDEMQRIEAIPKLILPDKYRVIELPYKLDNSVLPYFRPIFNQMGGSCAQASGVGYNFTYEMNSLKGTSAALADNQFPTHYTYNFLNDGSGEIGSTYFGGWDIINAGGIPNVTTYGGLWPSTDVETMHKIWMNGYEGYKSGMRKRNTETISIPVGTPEGLQTLKQYFNDYCDGSATGGIVNFSAGISWVEIDVLPAGTEEAGKSILWKWDSAVNHAMTFVGYNDSIRFDYNGDGKCTNDIDTNGDDIVDMKDWEIGALLMANSWGPAWYGSGKIWVAYRTLALDLEDGGIWTNTVYTIRVRDDFEPSLYLKSTLNFSDRKELKIYAGVSSDTTATMPEHTVSFPYFNYQGGAGIGMAGDGTTLEFGLDISPLLSFIESGSKAKFFLCVDHTEEGTAGRGSIVSFSIFDSSGTQFLSSQSTVAILKNATTYLTVNAVLDFNAPSITDENIPDAEPGILYTHSLAAQNGSEPYKWDLIFDYDEDDNINEFTLNTENQIIMSNDDDASAVIDLPFSFPFYGKLYDQVTVITDGSILFGGQFEYVRSEGDIRAFIAITAFGADLMSYPADGDGIFYSVDNECLTVRWITSLYDDQEVNLDFEIKIYADSRIEFFYGEAMTPGLYWASGISNAKVTDAVISSLSNVSDPSGLKTAFSTYPYPYGLELSPEGIFSGITYVPDSSWNILFRVTDDRNISDLKQLTFSTGTGIDCPSEFTVSDFVLNQNYPNPFNNETRIQFSLEKASEVGLSIFNSKGELVKDLVSDKLGKGRHSFSFSADDINSGVYFYRLSVNGVAKETKKMLYLK